MLVNDLAESFIASTSSFSEYLTSVRDEIKKDTLKNNHWYTYTAFEYEGEVFYSIEYRGIATEDELIREGVL